MTLLPEPREIRSLRRFAPSPAERDELRLTEHAWHNRESLHDREPVDDVVSIDLTPDFTTWKRAVTTTIADLVPYITSTIIYVDQLVLAVTAGNRSKVARRLRKDTRRRLRANRRSVLLASQPSYRAHR